MLTALGSAHRFRGALRGLVVVVWAFAVVGCGRVGYEPLVAPEETTDDGGRGMQRDAETLDTSDTSKADARDLEPDASSQGPDASASVDASADAVRPINITLPYLQDFEAPATTWTGMFVGSDGVAERSMKRSRGGAASFMCGKGSASGSRYLEVSLATAVKTGEIHSRVFVYAPSSWSVKQWVIPMEMKGTVTHDNKFSFDLAAPGYGTNLPVVGPSIHTDLTFPRDKWVCVELALNLSATKGWSRLYVDGALADEHIDVNTLLSDADPGIQRFRLGLLAAPSQGVAEMWFDDWAIATTRIGCL